MNLQKLHRRFRRLSIFSNIIQFSPVRSGSTLVYNLMMESLPGKTIFKRHHCTWKDCYRNKVVVTFRNPIDIIASSILRYRDEPTDQNILKHIAELRSFGLDDLMRIFDHPKILKLRYEDFYNNHDLIFRDLQSYFEIEMEESIIKELKQKYAVNRIHDHVAKSYSDFSQYDKKTHWHGDHVSKFKGKPDASMELFTIEQVEMIRTELMMYIEKFGYDENLEIRQIDHSL